MPNGPSRHVGIKLDRVTGCANRGMSKGQRDKRDTGIRGKRLHRRQRRGGGRGKYQGRTEEGGREMGSAVTYTYSPELQTDSGQILRIRGARLELIANVWLGTWILG